MAQKTRCEQFNPNMGSDILATKTKTKTKIML